MKSKKADDYAAFGQKFKARQAIAAATVAAEVSDSEDDAPAPKAKKVVGAGAGAGAKKAVLDDEDSDEDEEEAAPAPKAKPVVVVKRAPAHAALWTFGGQSYYKTAANHVWEVDLDDDGNQVVGDWAGVYLPSEDRIDDAVAEPATKPAVM